MRRADGWIVPFCVLSLGITYSIEERLLQLGMGLHQQNTIRKGKVEKAHPRRCYTQRYSICLTQGPWFYPCHLIPEKSQMSSFTVKTFQSTTQKKKQNCSLSAAGDYKPCQQFGCSLLAKPSTPWHPMRKPLFFFISCNSLEAAVLVIAPLQLHWLGLTRGRWAFVDSPHWPDTLHRSSLWPKSKTLLQRKHSGTISCSYEQWMDKRSLNH